MAKKKKKMPMTSGAAASHAHVEAKVVGTGSNPSFFTSRAEIAPPVLKNGLETPEKSSEDAPEKNPPRV